MPNKTVLTVCLLPGSSAKEQFWKLPSGLGFLLTLASICDRSMGIGGKKTKAFPDCCEDTTHIFTSHLKAGWQSAASVEVGVAVHRAQGLATPLNSPAFPMHLC